MRSGTEVPVAEMKTRLSDFIAKVEHGHESFVITRRSRPVAALVNIEDFRSLGQEKEKKGLLEAAGKWRSFEEISGNLARARKGGGGRHVSL